MPVVTFLCAQLESSLFRATLAVQSNLTAELHAAHDREIATWNKDSQELLGPLKRSARGVLAIEAKLQALQERHLHPIISIVESIRHSLFSMRLMSAQDKHVSRTCEGCSCTKLVACSTNSRISFTGKSHSAKYV